MLVLGVLPNQPSAADFGQMLILKGTTDLHAATDLEAAADV